jgi:hypothetical protein
MKIPLYFLDNSWCFIEITINSDGEIIVDWTELETEIEELIKCQKDTNILCLYDNRYCYYNPSKKKRFDVDQSMTISLSLVIRNFNILDRLAEINNLEKSEVEVSL